jgi:YgiT-type zinc finger domain-containing protein
MNSPTLDGYPRRCSNCGQVAVQPCLRDERFEYECQEGRFTIEAPGVPVEVCANCGETYSGIKAALIRTEAIGRALHLLPSQDIRGLRERLGKTLAEFARWAGIPEQDLSDWERGRTLQDRSQDWFLRLLLHNPENVKLLDRLHAENAPANGAVGQPAAGVVTPADTSAAGTGSCR